MISDSEPGSVDPGIFYMHIPPNETGSVNK